MSQTTISNPKAGDFANVRVIAERFRQANAGHGDANYKGFRVGPSGIRRLSKWRNRIKKAAQQLLNHQERAAENAHSRSAYKK